MLEARHGKEVVVKVKNDIGVLFELAKHVSEKGVSVLAVTAGVCGEDAVIRLVTDDNLRTKDVLAGSKFKPHEESVVLVELPHKPGMLKRIAETLAREGIDVHHLYATVAPGHDRCLLVFHSSNDDHALTRLQETKSV